MDVFLSTDKRSNFFSYYLPFKQRCFHVKSRTKSNSWSSVWVYSGFHRSGVVNKSSTRGQTRAFCSVLHTGCFCGPDLVRPMWAPGGGGRMTRCHPLPGGSRSKRLSGCQAQCRWNSFSKGSRSWVWKSWTQTGAIDRHRLVFGTSKS